MLEQALEHVKTETYYKTQLNRFRRRETSTENPTWHVLVNNKWDRVNPIVFDKLEDIHQNYE